MQSNIHPSKRLVLVNAPIRLRVKVWGIAEENEEGEGEEGEGEEGEGEGERESGETEGREGDEERPPADTSPSLLCL